MSHSTRLSLDNHLNAAIHMARNLREIRHSRTASPNDALFPDLAEYYDTTEAAVTLYILTSAQTVIPVLSAASDSEEIEESIVLTLAVMFASMCASGVMKPKISAEAV